MRGVLLIPLKVGEGPSLLAVDADRGYFSLAYH